MSGFVPTSKRCADDAGLRLTEKTKKRKLEEFSPEEIQNISTDMAVKQWEWVRARSMLYTAFNGKYAYLQNRLQKLIAVDDIVATRKWWEEWEMLHSKYKVKADMLGSCVRTMETIREAANSAGNEDTAVAAAWNAIHALNLLVTMFAHADYSRSDVQTSEKYYADIELRFEELLSFLERRTVSIPPAASTNAPSSSSTSASTAADSAIAPSSAGPSSVAAPISSANVPVASPATTIPLDRAPLSEDLLDRCRPYETSSDTIDADWEELQGIDNLKESLEAHMFVIGNKDMILSKPITPDGTLLYGPTGTGKTTIVMAFAKRYNLPLLTFGSEHRDSLVGNSEKAVKEVFELAVLRQPCVLLMDEADGILQKPSKSNQHLNGVQQTMKTCWGNLMNTKHQVFLFGTTNQPHLIDMTQFGRRFSTKLLIGLPDKTARRKILLQQTEHLLADELDKLAEATHGYTGFDIGLGIEAVQKAGVLLMSRATHFRSVSSEISRETKLTHHRFKGVRRRSGSLWSWSLARSLVMGTVVGW